MRAAGAGRFNAVVWDQRYIDAAVMQIETITVGSGVYVTRSHHTQDANFNVTAQVDESTGAVSGRAVYTPYGQRTVISGSMGLLGHQGLMLLPDTGESGMYYNRARFYHPTLGRFVQRDPLGYVDGGSLYEYEAGGPTGGSDPEGLRVDTKWEDYLRDFLMQHPDLTPQQRKWIELQLARGCVGVTAVNLGTNPDTGNCFKTKAQAEEKQKEMKSGCSSSNCGEPALFSIHLWNDTGRDGKTPDISFGPDGKADLSNWDFGGRPPGDWKPAGGGGYNFDFGFGLPGAILHANHYHNPDVDGDGVGDYYPSEKITTATVYKSSLQEWQASYADFNSEVWCVQCTGSYK